MPYSQVSAITLSVRVSETETFLISSCSDVLFVDWVNWTVVTEYPSPLAVCLVLGQAAVDQIAFVWER